MIAARNSWRRPSAISHAPTQIAPMDTQAVRAIESSVKSLLNRRNRLVVALSGGADSSVLLHAIARLRSPQHHIVAAVVDHGTGAAATEATALAVSSAALMGFPAISERLELARHDEASLRAGRWFFLRRVSETQDAPVVTAHSRDDHIETVVMRVLRGANARGVAGLLAPSAIERPLLDHSRSTIRAYAKLRGVSFTEDPTNLSLTYLRNRVRLQLLPAIRAVNPNFEPQLLALSRNAAGLRVQVDEVANQFVVQGPEGVLLALDASALGDLPDASMFLLWPALLAHASIALDRRGLRRLTEVVRSRPGCRGQLSGGYEAVRSKHALFVMPTLRGSSGQLKLREDGETTFADFRFRAEPAASIRADPEVSPSDWRIDIPRTAQPIVRQWHPGDRLTTDLKGGHRRVKRYFADAGVVGPLRTGWPVVVCGDDVIWIPGIKASQAGVRREGRMVRYTCERIRD